MNTKELDSEYIIGTYKRQDVVLVEGHGAVAHDETGKEYIDFGSGIGVNSLGYCDGRTVCSMRRISTIRSRRYGWQSFYVSRRAIERRFFAIPVRKRTSAR